MLGSARSPIRPAQRSAERCRRRDRRGNVVARERDIIRESVGEVKPIAEGITVITVGAIIGPRRRGRAGGANTGVPRAARYASVDVVARERRQRAVRAEKRRPVNGQCDGPSARDDRGA
jgi:hypothetical protein